MKIIADVVSSLLIAFCLVVGYWVTMGSGGSGMPRSYPDAHCVSPSCNNSTGCSWSGVVYTTWYPHGVCQAASPPGTGQPCVESYRKCRKDEYYGNSPCFNLITTSEHWEYGC